MNIKANWLTMIWTAPIKYFNKLEMKIKLIYSHWCYHSSECLFFISLSCGSHANRLSLPECRAQNRQSCMKWSSDATVILILFSTAAMVHGHNHNFILRQKAALQINYSALRKHTLQQLRHGLDRQTIHAVCSLRLVNSSSFQGTGKIWPNFYTKKDNS